MTARAHLLKWSLAVTFVSVVVLWLVFVTGCHGVLLKPDARTVLAAQAAKDTRIITSAGEIDRIATVDAPQAVAPIRAQTDSIRAAVAAAPAQDVAVLAAQFQPALDALESQVKVATARADQAEQRAAALANAEVRTQARSLRIAAAALLLIAGALAWGRQITFSGIAAASSLLCFGLAQLISQWWFMWASAGVVAALLVALAIAAVQAYRKGTLAAKVSNEAAKAKGTLAEIIPVLDDAYDNAEQSVRDLLDRTIFSRLKDAMTPAQRATVHAVRADQSSSQPAPTPVAQ